MFLCVSSSPGLPQGVVVSLVLHATECTEEHFVTALVNHFATLPPDIHNKRTALREACLLTLYHHAQLSLSLDVICGSRVMNSVFAPRRLGSSPKGFDRVAQNAVSSAPPTRETFLR